MLYQKLRRIYALVFINCDVGKVVARMQIGDVYSSNGIVRCDCFDRIEIVINNYHRVAGIVRKVNHFDTDSTIRRVG